MTSGPHLLATTWRRSGLTPAGCGAFEAWCEEHLGPGHPTFGTALAGGTQNVLIPFELEGRALVLRLPPEQRRSDSDHVMRREIRVLAALRGTAVPHATLAGAEPAEGPLGAPFLVMERVHGVPAVGVLGPPYDTAEWQRQIGIAMADAAAVLSEVDPASVGLDDLARPGSFLERQVGRWLAQLATYETLPGYVPLEPTLVAELSRWLEANRPPDHAPRIVHGDFHAANVLLATDRPGVAAILDWELSTIGDSLLDLGELLVCWPDRAGRSPLHGIADIHPADHLATEEEMVGAYAARSSRDLGALPWFKVLAAFRLAAIIEGSWARAVSTAERRTGAVLHDAAVNLLRRAEQVVREL